MIVQIIEKTMFFLGFFDILRKSLEALGNALGDPLGIPWGALGTPWEALGAPWETFGTPLECLGNALEGLGGPSWKTFLEDLGKTLEEPP